MGQHRMFSNRIANSAKFLKMPLETQTLYFHMILRADDDGIVESYPLMKLLGLSSDNFNILVGKGFIKQLNEDQVIVITDWQEHNRIRADRKINSIYRPLLEKVCPEIPLLEPAPRSDVKDNSKRTGGGQSTDSLSKVKLSKVKLSKVKKSSKEEEDTPTYGNEDINKLELLLKAKMNLNTLDGTKKENRQYCYLALKKFKGFKGVEEIIEAGAKDSFWQNNITDFKTIYYKAEKIKKVGKGYTAKEY